jgi:hypothetical protein
MTFYCTIAHPDVLYDRPFDHNMESYRLIAFVFDRRAVYGVTLALLIFTLFLDGAFSFLECQQSLSFNYISSSIYYNNLI